MTTLIKAAAQAVPKNIVNKFSSGATQTTLNFATGYVEPLGLVQASSINTTAGVLKEVLSITGAGCIKFLAAAATDATIRTLRMKLVLDGTTVFDNTTGTINTVGRGAIVIGGSGGGATQPVIAMFESIPFNSSLVFSVASSLTESNPFNVYYKYHTF